MTTDLHDKVARIRHLNDLLRCQGIGGQVYVTRGIDALGEKKVKDVIREIAAFTAFTPDNDPHREHDCALVKVGDLQVIWKIDYYDNDLRYHSPDASDACVTMRVMTVMLAEEY